MVRGKIDTAGLTDVGVARSSNQDQYLIATMRKCAMVIDSSIEGSEQGSEVFGKDRGHLFLVADGMGGHLGGDRASAVAVHGAVHYVMNTMPWFFRLEDEGDDDLRDELIQSVERANAEVIEAAAKSPALTGMGTTLTMAYLCWPRLYVVHAGDSRGYLQRGGRLSQLTIDHTVARKMVEEGVIDSDEEQASPYSHVLWNALGGGNATVEPSVYRSTLELGDSLLLCSDGLTNHVGDDAIAEILDSGRSAKECCRALVEAANADGGSDNITVVVARFLTNGK